MTPFDITFMTVASLLGIGLIAPQALRIMRTHNAAGVSVTGLVCSCISYAGWVSFAVHLLDIPMLVSLLLPFVLETITLVLAVRWNGETGGMTIAGCWLAAVVSASLIGWPALGALLAISIVWGYGPAVVEAWRAPDVSGVSVLAWRVRVLDGLAWASYGLVTTQSESLVYGTAAASLAVGVLVGLARARHAAASADLHAPTRRAVDSPPEPRGGSRLTSPAMR